MDIHYEGVILSGGPYSVYEDDAPHVDARIFDIGVPVLGICYGMQEVAWHFGKNVLAGEKREYGHAEVDLIQHQGMPVHIDRLFRGLEAPLQVFMSHGDKLSHLPDGFVHIASTSNAPFAGIAQIRKPVYGIQFHPEVSHTPQGTDILRNFAVDICGARQHWTMEHFVTKEIARIRQLVGQEGQVIGAVSGMHLSHCSNHSD